MNGKISFIPNADLGRYLQSLDSVRFLESNEIACNVQAKLEIFTSLMLGRTIPVGEHQFIDSYGLLSNAYHMIKALDKLPKTDRSQIEHIFPFQLYFRGEYKTIDGLIAAKLGDPNYKLSLWRYLSKPDDQKMLDNRQKIKAKVEDGTFKYEDDDLVPNKDYDAAKMLHKVRNHFFHGEREQIYTLYGSKTIGIAPYIGLLEAGISRISNLTRKDLNSQIKHQAKLMDKGIIATEILDPKLKEIAVELIMILRQLKKLGLMTGNRSNIRIGNARIRSRGKEKIQKFREIVNNDLMYDAILEIFDLLYNSSIAKSCFAHSESVSSARSITDNHYVQAAIALSTMAKNEITDQADLKGNYFNPPWIQDFTFNLNVPSEAKLMLDSMPWERVWEAFLDTKWRDTVSNLNGILLKWDKFINDPTTSEQEYMDVTYELDYAYDAHIDNISRILKESGWNFVKNQKTNQTIIKFLPWVGGLATKAVAKIALDRVGIDPFWEETIPDSIGTATGIGINKTIEPVGKWITKGYIRKTFARLVLPEK
ncbi:MAG: hypothetical protein QY328_10650 [Anaerolineales bacterium]|nr:MAG: hypothetical protein QY328_10650 [Anaerolineales bacterium]